MRKKMKTKGIDLSGYNIVTDYEKVASDNVNFVILKIIRKDLLPDKLFETHWTGFEKAGVPIQGVYNYSYATTVEKFKSDAQRVLEVLAGRRVMVWLDIEDKTLAAPGNILAEGIRAYGEVIQGAGLQFGIYTYLAFFNDHIKPYLESHHLDYPFWIARYPSTQAMDNHTDPDESRRPEIGRVLYGWQYSSRGIVNGISGYVDLDEWYVDTEAQEAMPDQGQQQEKYITDGFVKELSRLLGLPGNSSASDVLAKTVTVSAKTNRYHASVTALERLMKEYGFYTGAIEADDGKTPVFGNGMAKATALYQAQVVGLKTPDKEWTKGNKSYKKALGLI